MNYIDKIVFRMFKTLTDKQKYKLLEELTLENKELKKQLSICDVGCSLPSEEEVTAEIVDYIGINKLTKGTMLTERQCLAFEIGFRKCYGWLMKR